MAIKTNFLQPGTYNAADLVNEFGALFTDGMLTGGTIVAHSPANLSVDVPALKCLKAGLFLNSDSTVNVAIVANTSGYNRIDVIAADIDNQTIVAVQGTPSSSPTAPILTGNKIAIAQILVGNNVSVINQGNITDVRVNVDLFGSQLAAKVYNIDYVRAEGFASATGVNTYVMSLTPAPISYVIGQVFNFKATSANTGASTLNVNNLGAKSLVKDGNVALVTGDILAGQIITAKYDGVNFQIIPSFASQLAANVSEVSFFARNTAPTGYLKANGAAVSRTAYARLFTAIGTIFGVGDGSTTFNLPDLRGYFPRGWNDDGSIDSGRAFGSIQADALVAHTHVEYIIGNNGTGSTNGGTMPPNGLQGETNAQQYSMCNTSATGVSETRPKNIALLACIKY